MNMITRTMGAAALLALAIPMAQAQEAVGYNKIVVPADSDALISVPFQKAAEVSYVVDEVNGNVVTIAGTTPGSDSYAEEYYAHFNGDGGMGFWSSITGNTANQLTLTDDVPAGVNKGDTISVYPHHTLGSLFPQNLEGVTFVSSGDTGTEAGATLVLIPDTNTGINKSSGKVCQHFGQYGWFDGDLNNAEDIVIPPTTFVKVRNQDLTDLPVIVSGEVTNSPMVTALPKVAPDNDLYLANPYPVPVKISELGLESWASSDDGAVANGEILIFSNDDPGINKSAAKICFFFTGDGNWYDGSLKVATDLDIPAGMGVVLREQSDVSSSGIWSAPKPY